MTTTASRSNHLANYIWKRAQLRTIISGRSNSQDFECLLVTNHMLTNAQNVFLQPTEQTRCFYACLLSDLHFNVLPFQSKLMVLPPCGQQCFQRYCFGRPTCISRGCQKRNKCTYDAFSFSLTLSLICQNYVTQVQV